MTEILSKKNDDGIDSVTFLTTTKSAGSTVLQAEKHCY